MAQLLKCFVCFLPRLLRDLTQNESETRTKSVEHPHVRQKPEAGSRVSPGPLASFPACPDMPMMRLVDEQNPLRPSL